MNLSLEWLAIFIKVQNLVYIGNSVLSFRYGHQYLSCHLLWSLHILSHKMWHKLQERLPSEKVCVCCASSNGALAFLTLLAYVIRNRVWFPPEGKIVCLSFQSLIMSHCHIQEYIILMEEDGLTFKKKGFQA